MKVGQAEIEINKKKEEVKGELNAHVGQTELEQKLLRGVLKQDAKGKLDNLSVESKALIEKIKLKDMEKTLQNKKKE